MAGHSSAPCLSGCASSHPVDLGFRLCDAPVAELPLGDGRRLTVSVSRVADDGRMEPSAVSLGLVEADGAVREPLELSADVARLLSEALRCGGGRAARSVGLVA